MNYLPFGTCSSPGIFQHFLSEVLAGIENCFFYQDDLIVMNETFDQHTETLDKVLGALKNAGLKINRDKTHFFAKQVKYLGHIFDGNGVHMDPEKVRAILVAPSPKNLKEAQSFIGLANYFNRFIKNFSDVFAPLYALLKKNSVFKWEAEHEKCFQLIKKLFSTNIVLKTYNPNLKTALLTDASMIGVGATLQQLHGNEWFPIIFASRTLNTAEKSYSQIEREALSVIFGCEKFKKYLLGTDFILKNDHLPLKKLFSCGSPVPQNVSARLQRWKLRLSQYKFQFEFIKGVDNCNADFLSRLPLDETVDFNEPYEVIFAVNSLDNMYVSCDDVIRETNKDEKLLKLKSYIINGFPKKLDENLSEFSKILSDLTISKDCIMFQNRVFIPEILRKDVLKLFHEHHPGISIMRQMARSIIWYHGMDNDIINYVKSCAGTAKTISLNPLKIIRWRGPNLSIRFSAFTQIIFSLKEKYFWGQRLLVSRTIFNEKCMLSI